MSRAGAIATSAGRAVAEIAEKVGAAGIDSAALSIWELEEEARVQKSKDAIVKHVARLGLPEADAFVLERYETKYAPHKRVCVRYDSLFLNYFPGDGRDNRPGLSLIIGECAGCGDAPCLVPVHSFSDLAKPQLPHYAWTKNWLCSTCRRAEA